MSLQLNILERLIFMSKNWPNDPKIDLKPPSNLVEMIEKDLDFEEFESSFEQDEIVDIYWQSLFDFHVSLHFYNFMDLLNKKFNI
jgi:hypothetical protein